MPNVNKMNFRYALSTDANKIIHISEAKRGLDCHCRCVICGGILEAAKGDIREHYFRHIDNRSCNGGPETGLHLKIKQIILDNAVMKIPDRLLVYSDPRLEVSLGAKRPDVAVSVGDENIYLEIRVAHAIDTDKRRFYIDNKHKCIELDFSDKKYLNMLPEELEQIVLGETYNKKIIYWNEETFPAVQAATSYFNQLLGLILGVLIFIFFLSLAKPQKKR